MALSPSLSTLDSSPPSLPPSSNSFPTPFPSHSLLSQHRNSSRPATISIRFQRSSSDPTPSRRHALKSIDSRHSSSFAHHSRHLTSTSHCPCSSYRYQSPNQPSSTISGPVSSQRPPLPKLSPSNLLTPPPPVLHCLSPSRLPAPPHVPSSL